MATKDYPGGLLIVGGGPVNVGRFVELKEVSLTVETVLVYAKRVLFMETFF